MARLEIIAQTLQDAVEAESGGAGSLEIVKDLSVGGLTPDLDLVRAIRDAVKIDMQVMLRPHARDFVYTPAEQETILRDAEVLAKMGVTTLVFGALTPDSRLDVTLIRQVAATAQPLGITMHRAIDHSKDAEPALLSLKGVVNRVLSSGLTNHVWDGRDVIRAWVEKYGSDFSFVCGGGVTLQNLRELAQYTHAPEYHVGTAAQTNGTVDRDKVRALLAEMNG